MAVIKAHRAALLTTPDDLENQFYEAMREGDIDKLAAVWAEDDEVFCVHPGGPRVIGPAAVRASFEALFAGGGIRVAAERVRRVHTVSSATHSVVERVDIATAEGPQTAWVIATNVYVKTVQGWRMVAHHSSPGTSREPAEVIEAPSVLH
jgi:ketosteroid isomerase-like protein